MSLISKQVDELRIYAADRKGELAKLISDAADTIEMLSAKARPSAQPEKRPKNARKTRACDLISRQAAIDALMVAINDVGILDGDDIRVVFDNLPSAQPEIIRCKDCKHQVKEWREDGRFKDNGYWVHGCEIISDICGYWALFGHNDEFCSEAERREDG